MADPDRADDMDEIIARYGEVQGRFEELDGYALDGRDPAGVIADSAIDKACRMMARVAHEHYTKAGHILRARPGGLLRAPRLMSAVYAQILGKMESEGWVPPRRRVRIGRGRLLLTVLRLGLAG